MPQSYAGKSLALKHGRFCYVPGHPRHPLPLPSLSAVFTGSCVMLTKFPFPFLHLTLDVSVFLCCDFIGVFCLALDPWEENLPFRLNILWKLLNTSQTKTGLSIQEQMRCVFSCCNAVVE